MGWQHLLVRPVKGLKPNTPLATRYLLRLAHSGGTQGLGTYISLLYFAGDQETRNTLLGLDPKDRQMIVEVVRNTKAPPSQADIFKWFLEVSGDCIGDGCQSYGKHHVPEEGIMLEENFRALDRRQRYEKVADALLQGHSVADIKSMFGVPDGDIYTFRALSKDENAQLRELYFNRRVNIPAIQLLLRKNFPNKESVLRELAIGKKFPTAKLKEMLTQKKSSAEEVFKEGMVDPSGDEFSDSGSLPAASLVAPKHTTKSTSIPGGGIVNLYIQPGANVVIHIHNFSSGFEVSCNVDEEDKEPAENPIQESSSTISDVTEPECDNDDVAFTSDDEDGDDEPVDDGDDELHHPTSPSPTPMEKKGGKKRRASSIEKDGPGLINQLVTDLSGFRERGDDALEKTLESLYLYLDSGGDASELVSLLVYDDREFLESYLRDSASTMSEEAVAAAKEIDDAVAALD